MRYLFKGAFYCCSALIYIYINITGERGEGRILKFEGKLLNK